MLSAGLERLKRKRDRLKKREKKIKGEIQEQQMLEEEEDEDDDDEKKSLPSIKLNLRGDKVFVKKEENEAQPIGERYRD